ncbi:unnamed protein product [Lymnaea stagnalis]|uniref:Uncharacterized protein n=1 Tax=Lymnaea stagnalis TaxID=6523 RepID=A0AAV2IIY8_LYMST
MLNAWLLTTLLVLTAAWDGNKENCPLPPGAELYNPNPEVTVHIVSWTYDNEFLCYSDKPCHNPSNAAVNGTVVHTQDLHLLQEMFPDTTEDLSGVDVSTAGATVQPTHVTDTTPSVDQPVQLKPIMMQLGNILKFTPVLSLSTPFTMMVHEVDEAGFLACNTSGGIPILAAEANDTFEVPHKFLEPGVHYFIASSQLNIVARCEFGLRLNVTVKFNNCYTDHNTPCSGLGMCVTFPNEVFPW